MIIRSLRLINFRNYAALDLDLSAGVYGVVGDNAQGKTNLVEAMVMLSTMKSFRGVSNDAIVRRGEESAILRAEIVHDDDREMLVEIELKRSGRSTIQVNRKRINRTRDLLGALRTSVFSPDDRNLIHGAAVERRSLLDDALTALDPSMHDLVTEFERVVRQRNTLLKDLGPHPSATSLGSLAVWDEKMIVVGEQLGTARESLVDRLSPLVRHHYASLSAERLAISLSYDTEWRETGLSVALAESRIADLRRGTSTVGPHRDDLRIELGEFSSRTQGSHGEQHSLGIALRMAVHELVTERWQSPPVVVLDDVLAALDRKRAESLFERLLATITYRQVVVTSANPLPPSSRITGLLRISAGTLTSGTQEDA